MNFKDQRVSLFVDVQSVFLACRDTGRIMVNYESMLREILGDRPCVRAVAYLQYNQEPDVHKFARALNAKGFEVKSKPLLNFKNNELTWAVGMSLDMVDMVGRSDVMALVSHDPDFEDTLKCLSSKGVCVEVWGLEKSLGVLKRASGKFHFLEQCLEHKIPIDSMVP